MAASNLRWSPKATIVLIVVIAFLALIVGKMVSDGAQTSPDEGGAPISPTSITSVHNDAIADYQAALSTGKPVYVLFHSLTCEPCVEISAVVDQVMPGYADRIAFVNAISDDASGRELSAQFQFQYIPTSFFLMPTGEIQDTFTGAMGATELRGYLDRLLESQ